MPVCKKEEIIARIFTLYKKTNKRPNKRMSPALYSQARRIFGTWNNAMAAAGFEVKRFQKVRIPIDITPEFSYFLGLLITDGNMSCGREKRKYKLSIYTSYEEERGIIKDLIEKLFHYNAGIYKRKRTEFSKRPNYDIYICSAELVKSINAKFKIPVGNKSYSVKVPNLFYKESKQNINSFIRGIIDGDGCIKNNQSVNIASGSFNFLEGVKKLLLEIGIKAHETTRLPTAWQLSIYGKENLKKLYNSIYSENGSYYPRKREAWDTNIFK